MQASVVEAVISFSALENTKDLTCVSLISVCLDNVSLQFSSGHQSNKSVQIVKRSPKLLPAKQKKGRKSKYRQAVEILSQPVYIERCVKQREENMMSISIGRSHAQLRRLKNESTLLKDADITAIPGHRSKVLFSFQRCNRTDQDNCLATKLNNDHMGFIMFEAGLEKVALKAVKRKGFGSVSQKKEDNAHSETEVHKEDEVFSSPDDNISTSDNLSSPSTTINAEAAKNLHSRGSQNLGSCNSIDSTSSTPSKTAHQDEVSSVGYSGGSEESLGSCRTASAAKISEAAKVPNTDAAKSRPDHLEPTNIHTKCNSLPPDSEEAQGKDSITKRKKKDITSFSGEIRSVWLNFAAPPHTPITHKIDYTKLDWNLLSTASPSINAWMNPSDRLSVAVSSFMHISETRRLAVVASLMAEAIDVPGIHIPDKPRYWKIQPVSQTLQEDPSCQLCNVLRRYLLQPDKLQALEANLAPDHLPKLATLRQAIIVLSRQWKTVLYIPSLMERTVRHHQPHVTFKLSQSGLNTKLPTSRSHSVNIVSHNKPTSPRTVYKTSNTNEKARGAADDSVSSSATAADDASDFGVSSGSTQLPPKPALPSYPMTSSRASVIFPLRSSHTISAFHLPKLSSVTPHLNFFKSKSPASNSAKVPPPRPPPVCRSGPMQQPSEVGPLLSTGPISPDIESVNDEDEHISDGSPSIADKHHDLYTWMANQEDYKCQPANVPFTTDDFLPPMPSHESANPPHKHNTTDPIVSEGEGNESPQDMSHGDQFLAAHVIFAPLLSSIGVQTQQAPARALQQLGPNVCVIANIEALRVHIAESETKYNARPPSTKVHQDLPAFLCQKTSLDLDMRKVADNSWSGPALFVSRSALRRHTSTVIQFSLDINYVSQQVNMPLLRLLHQITSMYKNAKQTQQGLRDQRPTVLHGRKFSLPAHYRSQHFPEPHLQQPCSSSISEEHEQGTLSSIGGKTGQRSSVGSSLSLRTTPPLPPVMSTGPQVTYGPAPPTAPPSTSSNVSSSRLGRPQSFAQRLRSSTKLGRGYMNFGLERSTHSPLLGISISSSGVEGTVASSDKSPLLAPAEAPPSLISPVAPSTPRCWRNVYCLLDLYTTTPETKTLGHMASKRKYYKAGKVGDLEAGLAGNEEGAGVPLVAERAQGLGERERTPIVVLGVAKIQRTRLLASLSGLKLEAQMTGLQSSVTYKEKVRDNKTSTELSLTGQVDTSSIVLLEGNPQQTIVKVSIARSQALYSSVSRKSKDRNSALVSIGDIEVKIPQHPVILHDMMTRGTKQLSSTLQELRVSRPVPRLSRGAPMDDPDASPRPHQYPHYPEPSPQHPLTVTEPAAPVSARQTLLQPLVVQFSLVLQSVCVQAALLPSLQAQYRMEQLTFKGVTGIKAKFTAHLPTHRLSFSTMLQDLVS